MTGWHGPERSSVHVPIVVLVLAIAVVVGFCGIVFFA